MQTEGRYHNKSGHVSHAYSNECAHKESNLHYGWLGSSCLHDAIYTFVRIHCNRHLTGQVVHETYYSRHAQQLVCKNPVWVVELLKLVVLMSPPINTTTGSVCRGNMVTSMTV